jgi:hypothetical protein
VLVLKQDQAVAILLTHWHNADGTVTWLDWGSEQWGHEVRYRNGYSLMSPYMNLLALSGLLKFKLPRDDRSLHFGLSDSKWNGAAPSTVH